VTINRLQLKNLFQVIIDQRKWLTEKGEQTDSDQIGIALTGLEIQRTDITTFEKIVYLFQVLALPYIFYSFPVS